MWPGSATHQPCLAICILASHVLAILDHAAIHKGVQISFPPNVCTEAGLLTHMVVLFLFCLETTILFSIVTAYFTFPPRVSKGAFLSTPLPGFLSVVFLKMGILTDVRTAHCAFILRVPDGQWYIFFINMSVQVLCPF